MPWFQVNLLDAYETSKMLMLKFETLPGTDVISYLAEKSTYSEQVLLGERALLLKGALLLKEFMRIHF